MAFGQADGSTWSLLKSSASGKQTAPQNSAWEELVQSAPKPAAKPTPRPSRTQSQSDTQSKSTSTPQSYSQSQSPSESWENWIPKENKSETSTAPTEANSIWDDPTVNPDEGDGVEDAEEDNVQTQAEWEDFIANKKSSNTNSAKNSDQPKQGNSSYGSKIPGFPTQAFKQALAYFNKHKSSFSNKTYITVIDFTKASHKKRLFIVNLKTGAVEARLTTHGKGSDPRHSGYAKKFSNKHGSNATSVGFYRTLGMYRGNNGPSLKLQGLSNSNSEALRRAIVMHKAKYVSERGGRAGRSYGCFALDPSIFTAAMNKIKGGSLIYAWSGQK